MVSIIDIYRKVAYAAGIGGGVALGYGASYIVSDYMGHNEFKTGLITLGAFISKEIGFFSGNISSHSLFNSFCYKNILEWTNDLKTLATSNLACIGFGTAAKPILHAILMYNGMEPQKAMLWSYLPVGIAGIGLKGYLDYTISQRIKNQQRMNNSSLDSVVAKNLPSSN